jgi:uncharacterized membrane protein YagU involved in acid resistance
MRTIRFRPLTLILWGGLVAAMVDIGAACLISGRGVVVILRSIAGGLLGRAAMEGGTQTAILGFALQETMGVLIAAVYYLAAKLLPNLAQRWTTSGLIFGIAIFLVMNYLVLPLSAWRHAPHFTPGSFVENLIAMLVFGLVIAKFGHTARRP